MCGGVHLVNRAGVVGQRRAEVRPDGGSVPVDHGLRHFILLGGPGVVPREAGHHVGVAGLIQVEEGPHEGRAAEVGVVLDPRRRGLRAGRAGVAVVVGVAGDDGAGLARQAAGGLFQPDTQDVSGRVVRHPDPRDVEARDVHDPLQIGGDARVGDGWVIWDDDDAWFRCSGEIGGNVSREVDAEELTMIKVLHRWGGPTDGLRAAATPTPPRNDSEQPGNQ